MTTYYSIISVLIRPEIQEKVSVGVLLFDNEDVFFNYSKEKLEIIKQLLTSNSYKLIKEVLKQIQDKVKTHKQLTSARRKENLLISQKSPFLNEFNTKYIDYLHVYSNNAISFSSPIHINLPLNSESCNSLFYKYIDRYNILNQAEKRVKPSEFLRKKFKNEIIKHFDVDKEISYKQIPNLIAPVTVDFAGKNDIDVYVQTLDMEQHYNYICNDINAFFQLKSAYEKGGRMLQDYLVFSEPPKKMSKQHDIWEHLRNSKTFAFIDLSESEQIIEYAIKHDVKPMSSFEVTISP